MRRLSALGWAGPFGLATGLIAWLVAGGGSAAANHLDDVEALVLGVRVPPPAASHPVARNLDLVGTPLFALTTGPGALREPGLRIDGITLSKRRTAALVSIDGKPAAWMTVGENVDGVTLQSVTATGATFETELGSKTLNLGEQSAASAPDPHASPAALASSDPAPQGLRSPPEPASAAIRH